MTNLVIIISVSVFAALMLLIAAICDYLEQENSRRVHPIRLGDYLFNSREIRDDKVNNIKQGDKYEQ